MKTAVIVFPGSNCDRDMAVALQTVTNTAPYMVWHKDQSLPEGVDLVAIPGGFSFGDYLRCGAIAAKSPIMKAVIAHVKNGGYALGVCNGFQVLTESGLLPGTLMRNSGLSFLCRNEELQVVNSKSPFTNAFKMGEKISVPIAHHDGNYRIDDNSLQRLIDNEQIAFKYVKNPNGSIYDIAGVLSENHRVLGMMPHPERAISKHHAGQDGLPFFQSLIRATIEA